jgi:N-acetylmuramoyl-L-alanine amidase
VDGPDRLFYDFRSSQPVAALEDAAASIDGSLVRGFRVGRHPDQVTRVVFELEGAPRHSAFLLYEPFRLVIDLESDTLRPPSQSAAPAPVPFPVPAGTPLKTSSAVSAPPPPIEASEPAATPVSSTTAPAAELGRPEPPASTSRGDFSLSRQLGRDPGAQANGLVEAELVLDVAHRLETLLKAHPGVEVMLTRSDDRFIPLEERTAIANRESADLFVSIHANASRQASTRGVETYVLNFATNEAAEEVAARENSTSARSMGTLPDIVKTIAMNDKLVESRELATMVQTALVRSLRTQSSGVRDLGVKQAPFVVLIGAEMPSVLAEISFLTNKPEADLLKTSDYRQRIAQALHDAIVKYQSSLKKITAVAPHDESRQQPVVKVGRRTEPGDALT